jgi:hypothetical protein
VDVHKGVFSVNLDVTSVQFTKQYFIETQIVTDPPLAPRRRLTGVPYALAPWSIIGSDLSYTSGNVGIGTTTPANKLDVEGGAVVGATYSGTSVAPTDGLLVEGNVGIGTMTPTAKLQIGRDDATSLFTSALETVGILNTNTTFNNWSVLSFQGNTTGGAAERVARIGAQITAHGASTVTGDLVMSTVNAGTEAERMRVGIGTTTPANKLDVEGGAVVGAAYSGTSAAPTNGLLVEGNIGIGTSTPANKLDVEGGAVVGATYSGTNTAPANGLLVEGNVGIGTASPSAALEVNGSVKITGGTPGAGEVLTSDGSGFATWELPGATSGTDGWTDDGPTIRLTNFDNKVGIGTASTEPPVNTLDVEGGVTIGATYSGSSTAPANGLLVEGNVGIGTALDFTPSPTNRLRVALSDAATNLGETSHALGILNTNTTDNNWSVLSFQTMDGPVTHLMNAASIGMQAYTRNTNWLNSDLVFSTSSSAGNNERMRIASSGNVGIGTGTVAPTSRLSLLTDDYHPFSILTHHKQTLKAWVPIVQRVERDGGNVTSNTPMGGIDQQVLKDGGWTSLSWIRSTYLGDGYTNLSNMQFGGSGSTRMTLDENGNLGIGTTEPSERLDVSGSIKASTSLKVGSATIYSGTGSPNSVVTGNVGDLYLRTDGAAGTSMYVKESGTGTNTGWVGK